MNYPKLASVEKIDSPAAMINAIKAVYPKDNTREHFLVFWLSSSNKVIGYEIVSIGDLNTIVVSAREVFRSAIVAGCKGIILVHNHPSNNLEPSYEDIDFTKKMVEAGKLLKIPVYDHLIVGNNFRKDKNYFSFLSDKKTERCFI